MRLQQYVRPTNILIERTPALIVKKAAIAARIVQVNALSAQLTMKLSTITLLVY